MDLAADRGATPLIADGFFAALTVETGGFFGSSEAVSG
jgi:hypothetical protein